MSAVETLSFEVIETPLGRMKAIASQSGLCALEFEKPAREALLATRLQRWFPGARLEQQASPHTRAARSWLAAYFAGRFSDLVKIDLDLRGAPFERSVWKELMAIELGVSTSYSRLAEKVGSPKAYRAVGSASRKNPVSLIVPCHRVLGADGALRGYGGGIDEKGLLLKHESDRRGLPWGLS